jgi:pimeloyl-ACP methyl ester carboxylesterase
VTGVVAQAGVVDLRLASELGLSRGVVDRFLGGTPAEVPDRYAAASPAERLPLGVPALLTHGGRDDVVPPVISERFAAAARAAGDAVALVVEPGEDHFGHLDPGNPLWRAVTAWIR